MSAIIHKDLKGERLFRDISSKDYTDLAEEYEAVWDNFAVKMKAKVVERMLDDRRIKNAAEMDSFLKFTKKGQSYAMIHMVLDSLINSVCTFEMMIKVMMDEFETFGLARTLIEQYVVSDKRAELLDECEMRSAQPAADEEEEGMIEEEPAVDAETEYLGHFREVVNGLTHLFKAQSELQHCQLENPHFYKFPEILDSLVDTFTNLSQLSPVTTFPRQNLTTEVLTFLIENMSQLTNLDSNSFHVSQRLVVEDLFGGQGDFLLRMNVLVRQKLWCKGTSKTFSDACQNIMREVSVLSQLRHPNIVCLAGVLIGPDSVYVLTHMHGTGANNLEDHLKASDYDFYLKDLLKIMRQVCSALEFMHMHQPYAIFHNNVELANVLVDKTFSKAKLCGYSRATTGKPCKFWNRRWEMQENDLLAVGRTVKQFMSHLERPETETTEIVQWYRLTRLVEEIRKPPSKIAADYNIGMIRQKLKTILHPDLASNGNCNPQGN